MSLHPSFPAASVESLRSWLIAWLAGELKVDQATIDPSRAFLSYGIDSIQSMSLVGDLEVELGRRLPPTLAWDYPDVNALARHLAELVSADGAVAQPSPAASRAEVESLLAKIDQISDRDVESLLAQYDAKS